MHSSINTLLSRIMALLGIAIIFLGAAYSNPNAEDFSLTCFPKNIGIYASIIDLLAFYDGRYFTNFLHGVNPLAFFWISGYKLMPIIGVLLFIYSIYYVGSVFMLRRVNALLFALFFTTTYLAIVPSIGHHLYWMVSSFVFLWSWILFNLFLGTYLRYRITSSATTKSVLYLVLMLLLFCGIGMNEMFLPVYLLLLILIFAEATTEKSLLIEAFPLLSVGAIAILLFISSPGIKVRSSIVGVDLSYIHLIENVISCVGFIVKVFIDVIRNPLFILLVVVVVFSDLFELNFEFFKKGKVKNRWLTISLIGMSFIMALPYFLTMYQQGEYPERIANSIMLPIMLALLISVQRLISYLKNMLNFFQIEITTTLALIFFGITLFTSKNNCALIVQEYNSGVLARYDAQCQKRYSILMNKREANTAYKLVTIDSISTLPKSIYLPPEIRMNRETPYWNIAYESYFNLDEVRLRGDTIVKFNF